MEVKLPRFWFLLITVCSYRVVAQENDDTRNIVENLRKEFQVLKNRITVMENIVNGQNAIIRKQSANIERLEKFIKAEAGDPSPFEIMRIHHSNGLNSPSMNESRTEMSSNRIYIGPKRKHNFEIKSSPSHPKHQHGESRIFSRKYYSFVINFLFSQSLKVVKSLVQNGPNYDISAVE